MSEEKKIDLSNFDVEDLEKIAKLAKEEREKKVKYRAIKLLRETLGDQNYLDFIHKGFCTIEGGNEVYKIYNDGIIKVFEKPDHVCTEKCEHPIIREGQIHKAEYPAGDVFATLVIYIKSDPAGLKRAWGCGNLSLLGGEIKSD